MQKYGNLVNIENMARSDSQPSADFHSYTNYPTHFYSELQHTAPESIQNGFSVECFWNEGSVSNPPLSTQRGVDFIQHELNYDRNMATNPKQTVRPDSYPITPNTGVEASSTGPVPHTAYCYGSDMSQIQTDKVTFSESLQLKSTSNDLPLGEIEDSDNKFVHDTDGKEKRKFCLTPDQRQQFSKKRKRFSFSAEHLKEFEQLFQQEHYPKRSELSRLQQKFDIPEEKVKTWFQNRRAKEKKVCLLKNSSGLPVPINGKEPCMPTDLGGKPIQHVAPVKQLSKKETSHQTGDGNSRLSRDPLQSHSPNPGVRRFAQMSVPNPTSANQTGRPFLASQFIQPSGFYGRPPVSPDSNFLQNQRFLNSLNYPTFANHPYCSPVGFQNPFSPWNREGTLSPILSPRINISPNPSYWPPTPCYSPPIAGLVPLLSKTPTKRNISEEESCNTPTSSAPTANTHCRSSSPFPKSPSPGTYTSLCSPNAFPNLFASNAYGHLLGPSAYHNLSVASAYSNLMGLNAFNQYASGAYSGLYGYSHALSKFSVRPYNQSTNSPLQDTNTISNSARHSSVGTNANSVSRDVLAKPPTSSCTTSVPTSTNPAESCSNVLQTSTNTSNGPVCYAQYPVTPKSTTTCTSTKTSQCTNYPASTENTNDIGLVPSNTTTGPVTTQKRAAAILRSTPGGNSSEPFNVSSSGDTTNPRPTKPGTSTSTIKALLSSSTCNARVPINVSNTSALDITSNKPTSNTTVNTGPAVSICSALPRYTNSPNNYEPSSNATVTDSAALSNVTDSSAYVSSSGFSATNMTTSSRSTYQSESYPALDVPLLKPTSNQTVSDIVYKGERSTLVNSQLIHHKDTKPTEANETDSSKETTEIDLVNASTVILNDTVPKRTRSTIPKPPIFVTNTSIGTAKASTCIPSTYWPVSNSPSTYKTTADSAMGAASLYLQRPLAPDRSVVNDAKLTQHASTVRSQGNIINERDSPMLLSPAKIPDRNNSVDKAPSSYSDLCEPVSSTNVGIGQNTTETKAGSDLKTSLPSTVGLSPLQVSDMSSSCLSSDLFINTNALNSRENFGTYPYPKNETSLNSNYQFEASFPSRGDNSRAAFTSYNDGYQDINGNDFEYHGAPSQMLSSLGESFSCHRPTDTGCRDNSKSLKCYDQNLDIQ